MHLYIFLIPNVNNLKKIIVFPSAESKELSSKRNFIQFRYMLDNAPNLEEITLVDFKICRVVYDIYTPLNKLHKVKKFTLKNCSFTSESVLSKLLQKLPPNVESISVINLKSKYMLHDVKFMNGLNLKEFIYNGINVYGSEEARLIYSCLSQNYSTLETLQLDFIRPLILKSFVDKKVMMVAKPYDIHPLFLCENLKVLTINITNEIHTDEYIPLLDLPLSHDKNDIPTNNVYNAHKANYKVFFNKLISSGGYNYLESFTITSIYCSDWTMLSELLNVLPNLNFFSVKEIRGYRGVTFEQDSFINKCRSRGITIRIPL